MSRTHRIFNLVAVGLPPIATIVAIVLLWNSLVGWTDLAIMAVMYLLCGLGVTIGYHRLLTHRSFKTSGPVRAVLTVLGSMSVQGPALMWVADHRKHHAFSDEEGDPHSPHVHAEDGLRGTLRGLWHAHMGWLFSLEGRASPRRYAPDLLKDPAMRTMSRWFPGWVLLGLAIPFVAGGLISGSIGGALTGLLWGGFVRIFLQHHVTWSINSVCHFMGRRRFEIDDESRNVFWLAPFSLGESWHHNHHAFPTSAFHGMRRGEFDIAGITIAAMEKLGLVWDVVRISPERQREKAIGAAAVSGRESAAPS